jgi:hypothetical protein
MRAVGAACHRAGSILGADGVVLGKREEDDTSRCAARANDHVARKDPPALDTPFDHARVRQQTPRDQCLLVVGPRRYTNAAMTLTVLMCPSRPLPFALAWPFDRRHHPHANDNTTWVRASHHVDGGYSKRAVGDGSSSEDT